MKKLILLLVIPTLMLVACTGKKQKQDNSSTTGKYIFNEGFIHGTIYHIIYEHPQGIDLKTELEKEMQRFDMSLSTYKPESVISRFNQNDTEVVSDHFFTTCFQRAQEISAATDGAFDITVAPLVNAWGFGFKHKEKITPELIDSLLKSVGWQKVKLVDGKLIKDDPNTMLDASAIAKGYSVDVAGQFLEKAGCLNYMVEIGGEVVAKGKNPKGKWWRIGINKPEDNAPIQSELEAVVTLQNSALATSGNYRNFYIEGGKRYAHTIDPKTGYPVQHNVLSATVIAKDCMTADAFATSFMVMGLENSKRIVKEKPELAVFLIYSDENGNYRTWCSPSCKALISKP